MKKCMYCNCEIDDKSDFCVTCGASQGTEYPENQVNSNTEKIANDTKNNLTKESVKLIPESTEEKIGCEMRKGFKGFWWNLINCGKLNKKDQKSVMVKTAVGCAVLMVLIVCLTVGAFGVAEIIENSKRYTYMSTKEFVQSWNTAAVDNVNGITSGVKLDTKDLILIDLNDTDEIDIKTRGADIITINFKSSAFMDGKYNRYDKIEELLRICFPESSEAEISKWLDEYKEDEADKAISGIDGFKMEFEEVENKKDFKMNIKTIYSYTNNIIKSELPWGCAFNCNLEEFKTNHNQKISEYFYSDPVASEWYISDLSVFGEESYGNGKITQYGFVYYVNNAEIGSVYLFVDSQSEKITMVEYQTIYDTAPLSDEEFEICYKTIPTCILSALGFSEYNLYDDYILKAINIAPEMEFYRGVRIIGAGVPERNINMFGYRACNEEFFEAEKDGKVDEFINALETNKGNNVVVKTEKPNNKNEATDTTEITSGTTETQGQTTNIFVGKSYVNAGDFSPVCDYSLVNSLAFDTDKVTLQINLMEFVVSVEANYTIVENTVVLGEILTEAGDVMIEEGVQFSFENNALIVSGMTQRFVLSGWTCPYQFNDGESFIEVEV